MAIENLDDILITDAEKESVRKNSPSTLPLNPTAQGWSAQKIREKLYRAICSETGGLSDNILDILDTKLLNIKEIFADLDLAKASQSQLDSLFDDLVAGTITVLKAERDNEGNIIKSNYGSSITFDYEESTRVLTLKLFAKDGSQLGSDLTITLPNATQSASGLMSKDDKTNLNTLLGLLGVIGGDADSTVNKIREVLDIFHNYPEGDKLLDVLATKATKEELAVAGFPHGWTRELLTPTALTNGQTISKETLEAYDIITLIAINTATSEIDTDTIDTGVGLVDAYKYIFFDNASVFLTIGSTCTFTDNIGGYQLKIIGQKYEAQDAENVKYDKTVKNLLEAENVQDAIDEIADEVLAPAFVEVEHLALQSEITATNDIEIKDDSGELVKITGNTPTNLVINSDLLIDSDSNGVPDGFVYKDATDISLTNGIAKFTATANFGRILRNDLDIDIGETIYYFARVKTSNDNTRFYGGNSHTSVPNTNSFEFISAVRTPLISTNIQLIGVYDNSLSNFTPIEVDYMGAYNVSDMIRQGVKNDDGIPFANLTNEEIKEQLDIWHEVGYPTHINKLISKSDNLFNGKFNTLTSLESENLVSNSDLLVDDNNDGVPDGFYYNNATDISLTNGIAKFTATAQYGYLNYAYTFTANDLIYFYANLKSDSNLVGILGANNDAQWTFHSGSGNYEFISNIKTATPYNNIRLSDRRSSGWTPIEVDYIGAINITDLVSRGILPQGLTTAQYKEILDNAMYNNVPLRESDFISVEPSVAYRLIKASENSAIHKVIEYTTDNQVVKVNSVDYSGNVKISSPITMNTLTRKVKLISDLMDRPSQLLTNPNFDNGTANWLTINPSAVSLSVSSNVLYFTAIQRYGAVYEPFTPTIGDMYYFSAYLKADSNLVGLYCYYSTPSTLIKHSGSGNFEFLSTIATATDNTNDTRFRIVCDFRTSGWTESQVKSPNLINITDFIKKGVADDNGTLFSRLTNDEIKDQMDIWVQNGFPDSVINALYPDGADTAISLKYNDGDAIYYPQVIDELPLDITLRSGEYWQDGYIVKANGNAEASPLGKVFSAWNYGQIEAIYDSGVPADFKVKYAQNISAQVSTHSEYLKEARERLDTLRVNQKQLIKKLGIDVDNDVYDSFVGITSEKFEYYQLEGIKSGNILKVEGRGQSVANLLVNTIASSITGFGLTITYDDTTGMFTVNGTTTSAGNIILKTGMNFGLPVGTTTQLMRYFDSGTIDLNGSYVGYLISGTSVSNRINENSESLYDPYINGVGELKPDGANPNVVGTSGQSLVFQVYKDGMVFTNFKFKVALYEGTKLLPFAMPEATNNADVDVYNRTANILDMGTSDIAYTAVSGITIGYNALAQEFVISGTATANNTITLKASILDVVSGDRVSIKRLFQSGDITAVSTLPTIELFDGTSVVLANSIYKMTAPEGETPTPDVSFNTGTIPSDGTLTLRLQFKDDDVFDNYRFRLMIHDKSTDIGYVAYNRTLVGSLTAEANETDSFEFSAIDFGVLEFIPKTDKLNVVFGDTITDTDNSVLEYNAGIQSPNRKISVLETRMTALDNPFRDKVIAIWGDSRESNNPTSDPSGVGDQKDTSYPALLAKKLGATVLNFGLSGGAWAENTVQQDAASAIVNRVLTEDTSASADVIIISSMNDFKLATPLGSSATTNKSATTFYGAMRLTYDRLATKYPAKKIWLVLPQKRYDESVNYGGGDYYAYRKAQIDVAREYGIPTIDLYNNFPNTKPTFYATNMLNDTHFSAIGNELVAEIIARSLLGNGNSGNVDTLPALPTANGTYTLKLTVLDGVNTFSWILDS